MSEGISVVWEVVKESVELFERNVRQQAEHAVIATAEAIRADAEETAPHEHENRIGKSVAVVLDEDRLGAEIGTSGRWAYLGHMHEHGTVKMGAHPFLGPAAERNARPNVVRVEEAITRAIEETG